MYLSPDISPLSLWLLAACFLCVLLLAAILFFRLRSVVVYRRRADAERPDVPDADLLPASVVIYSQGDADSLLSMLQAVLAQDYPAAFEVIVVNNGESPDVRDTVSMLRATHPNLYLTFTPEGVVNLSRKKLALTLGIKAARFDVVVLTTTGAEILSPLWLRRMMSPFSLNKSTEIVLGYTTIDPDEDELKGRRRRAFDYAADSARWLGVAIAGKPFRGTEFNIAYRKELFMRNKGFARTLNLHAGDDDVFISEIAHGGNTVVELSEDSLVRQRMGNSPRIARERALQQAFTEGFIRRRPRILWHLTGWLQIAATICAILGAWAAYPNMQPAIIAAAILLLMCGLDIYFWRKALLALQSRPLRLSIPWLSATYPIRRLSHKIRSRIGKQKKYTWD